MGFEQFWEVEFHTDDVEPTAQDTARACGRS